MNKKFNNILGISFIVYIGIFFVLCLIGKEKDFSELENRVLAKKPKFTKEDLWEGTYSKKVEEYIADQFPYRDRFVSLKSYSELIQGKMDNNGIYIGKQGYLLQKFEEPDKELMEKNIAYLNEFSQKFDTYLMAVPTASKIYEDKLPPFATMYDEERFITQLGSGLDNGIKQVELIDALTGKSEEYIYYRTDHHWTTLGAYYGYRAFCETYGIKPVEIDEFNRVEVSESFYGSLFSKGNFSFVEPDTLELFESENIEPVGVTYVATDRVTDTLYEKDRLATKDKYGVFLDSNHPIVVIKTSVRNAKKLVVIKDSYANSFIPFLTAHFEEIHILDPRFLNMPIAGYITGNGIEDVLFLYNVQSLAVENKFSLLIK